VIESKTEEDPCSVLKQSHSPEGGEIMLRQYETIYVLNPEIGEENTKALVEKFKDMMSNSAQIDSMEEWGRKKLAYPIDYKTEGYYVLTNFTAEPNFPQELERVYKITEDVIKYIVIKKD